MWMELLGTQLVHCSIMLEDTKSFFCALLTREPQALQCRYSALWPAASCLLVLHLTDSRQVFLFLKKLPFVFSSSWVQSGCAADYVLSLNRCE